MTQLSGNGTIGTLGTDATPPLEVVRAIYTVREQKVILDIDLAGIYGVETRALNQAIKRNRDRFPADFVFELRREEILRISQTVTSLRKLKFSKQVHAFTEHGALMGASLLNSPRAVAMSVYVIRAFVKMRQEIETNTAILKRLAEIDKTLLVHDAALRDILRMLRPLLEPPPTPPKPEIGFHVKEDAAPYRTGRAAGTLWNAKGDPALERMEKNVASRSRRIAD